MGDLFPAFRGKEEVQSIVLVAVFNSISPHTSCNWCQYATVAYLGVGCPDPQQE